jgi:hypothetical protein
MKSFPMVNFVGAAQREYKLRDFETAGYGYVTHGEISRVEYKS